MAIEAAKKPGKAGWSKFFLHSGCRRHRATQRNQVTPNHPPDMSQWNRDHVEEGREEYLPSAASLVAVTAAIAAVYTYFLGFAQFGFLHALTAALGEKHPWLKPILAVMAGAGIGGGALAAKLYRDKNGRNLLRTGFIIAGLAAGLAWVARTPPVFLAAALLSGLGLGLVTVILAAVLRREIGGGRLGLCIGIGTGFAYGLCSLPAIFSGPPAMQVLVAIIAAGVGLIAVQDLEQRAPRQQISGSDYTRAGIVLWVAVFLVLVGSDSAIFYVIQHQPVLRAAWPVGTQLGINAGVHVLAAILAGLALDRRWITGTVLAGAVLLATASLWFAGGPPPVLAAHLYSAGVSIYSVALVFYPARRGQPGLAALLYAVAGWTGSGLGIGAAENLDRVPRALPVVAFLMIAGLLAARAWRK